MARNYKDIQLKNLIHKFMKPKEEWAHKDRANDLDGYPWEELKESIKRDGLLKTIRVRESFLDGADKYKVVDGNHRIKVLIELHGEEYTQTCVIVPVGSKKQKSKVSFNREDIKDKVSKGDGNGLMDLNFDY
tara:strand:- start:9058 stop:9453 length:396 start_codon:yes stop_codon:yes gene_type:complete